MNTNHFSDLVGSKKASNTYGHTTAIFRVDSLDMRGSWLMLPVRLSTGKMVYRKFEILT